MARKSATHQSDTPQPWQKWPRSPDVREWMQALLGLTNFMTEPDQLTSSTVVVALGELARLGTLDEALAHLERIYQRLPDQPASALSRMAMTGADISLEANDLERVDGYLRRVLNLQKLFTRKVDGGCQEKAVRRFQIMNGLLPPSEAEPDERPVATFNHLIRESAVARGRADLPGSVSRLLEAETLLPSMSKSRYSGAIERLAIGFFHAGDEQNLQRLLNQDALTDSRMQISPRTLLELGQHSRAIARYQDEARTALEELRTETLNAHFPAGQLERAIIGLADAGAMDVARKWLSQALAEGETWKLIAPGAFSSAVFRSIATAVARVDGNEAALSLLQLATERASQDHKSDWRTTAIRENAELLVELSPPDEALKIAKKLRSRTTRLQVEAKIFAKSQDWDALHALLNSCKTPFEAAEVIWWMKFVWRSASGRRR